MFTVYSLFFLSFLNPVFSFLLLFLFPLGRWNGMLSSFLYFESSFLFIYFLSAWQMFTVNSHLVCILKTLFLFILFVSAWQMKRNAIIFSVSWKPLLFVYFVSVWQMFTVNSHLFCILKPCFCLFYWHPFGRLNGMELNLFSILKPSFCLFILFLLDRCVL